MSFDFSIYTSEDFSDYTPPNLLYYEPSRTYHTFEPKNLVFRESKRQMNTGKMIDIKYKLNVEDAVELVDVNLKTPTMLSLWGLSGWESTDGKKPSKYSLSLSYSDIATERVSKIFYQAIQLLDKRIIEEVFKNRQKWFDTDFSNGNIDVISNCYKGMTSLRTNKDKTQKYPPRLDLKTRKAYNAWQCKVFDSEGNEIQVEELKPQVFVRCLFQLKGLWFDRNNFNAILELKQAQMDKGRTIDRCVFDDVDAQDDSS